MDAVDNTTLAGIAQHPRRSRSVIARSNGSNTQRPTREGSVPPPTPESTLPLPALLLQRRVELGMSQGELAELAGGSWRASDIVALESGRVILPSWVRLLALTKALKLPPEALLQAVCPTCDGTDSTALPQAD